MTIRPYRVTIILSEGDNTHPRVDSFRVLIEGRKEGSMVNKLLYVVCKIRLALLTPCKVQKFDEWFNGDYSHSIRFEHTEDLVKLYEDLYNTCVDLKLYGLKKRYFYYHKVLLKVDRELSKRSELFDESPEKYFEKYGAK